VDDFPVKITIGDFDLCRSFGVWGEFKQSTPARAFIMVDVAGGFAMSCNFNKVATSFASVFVHV
jgi:hypothetical protein